MTGGFCALDWNEWNLVVLRSCIRFERFERKVFKVSLRSDLMRESPYSAKRAIKNLSIEQALGSRPRSDFVFNPEEDADQAFTFASHLEDYLIPAPRPYDLKNTSADEPRSGKE